MIGRLLDTILDRTIVGGYTRIGYSIRSRQWQQHPLPQTQMDGRVVLITGASSGLGVAAAEGCARLGASVWLLVRERERGESARAAIQERSGHDDVHVAVCDLSRLASVREFARSIETQVPRLDVLIHNASVLPDARHLSEDGSELTFATNVIGPFLLTCLLLPLLRQGAPARVIAVSSGGMYGQRIDIRDPQSEHGQFSGTIAYARTKRAQVILTELAAARFPPEQVVFHAMHPGWVNTPGVQSSLPGFYKATRPLLRTPKQGADTIVWLAAASEPAQCSGRFWHDRRPRPTHLLPWTHETDRDRELLWERCAQLAGCDCADPTEFNPTPRNYT